MRVGISNYQLPLLRLFISQPFVTIENAHKYDQRAFRSFLVRGWLAYRPGHGFHLTPEGRQAWDVLHHTEIKRHDPTRPLTRYFDYVAYGFEDPYKKKKRRLRVVHRGAA